MTIRELWHTSDSGSEIRTRIIDSVTDDDILVRSEYSLISAGTERIVASGKVPSEITEIMKVPGMDGDFRFPVKYGYSLAGKVIQGPKNLMGRHIHLMHPHQDHVLLNGYSYSVVPPGITAKRAVLASVMETALTILWDSEISAGDHVLVCGFGIVGALAALLLRRIPAVTVTVKEKEQGRSKIALSLGFRLFDIHTLPKRGFDCSVNTSGSAEGLQSCIDTSANDAIIIEASWYGNKPVNLHLGTGFHPGRRKIVSSQVSRIPLSRTGRYDYERRKRVVFQLLNDPVLDRIPIMEILLDDTPALFDLIRKQQYNHLCTVVKY